MFLISGLVVPILLVLRVLYVDWHYERQPVETSFFSDGGYVEPGVYGHGDLRLDGGGVGWVIYDEPADNGRIRKSCVSGEMPEAAADVDFVYHNGLWYKLRSGTGILQADGFTSNPAVHVWRGWLKSPVTFPVKRPPLAYQLKIMRDKVMGRGTSPRQYLQFLKKTNPSCFEMPEP